MNKNIARIKAADVLVDVYLLVENIKHFPGILESEIMELLWCKFQLRMKAACTSCTIRCHHSEGQGVHLILGAADDNLPESACSATQRWLSIEHHIRLIDVALVEMKVFDDCNNEVRRYTLRDAFLSGRLADNVLIFTTMPPVDRTPSNPSCDLCARCVASFGNVSFEEPLSWRNVDILKEWFLYVPLPLQIILQGQFMNQRSIDRATDLDNYMIPRIGRFYLIYDLLLNLSNRNYYGVIQKLATFVMYTYHGYLSETFSLTNQYGLTQGIKVAENFLRSKTSEEYCYFFTYLCKHPLKYDRIDHGNGVLNNSMQDCHSILYLDNLVRLSVRSDPEPGRSRTNQICTLPMTIKGIPKDSVVIQEWHSAACSARETYCPCKEGVVLESKDIDIISKMTSDEHKTWEEFLFSVTWELASIWTTMKQDPKFGAIVQSAIDHNPNDDVEGDSELLETSFQQLLRMNELSTDDDDDDGTLEVGNRDDEEVITDELENELFQKLAGECPEYSEELGDTDETESVHDDVGQPVDVTRCNDEERFELDFQPLEVEPDLSGIESLSDFPTWDVHETPNLLCRHPYPGVGRDDDINVIKGLLDGHLEKMGITQDTDPDFREMVYMGPDNKIGKIVLTLQKKSQKYRRFLLEFPLLHLRKSKIVNLLSGYKTAMTAHLFKFMFDDDSDKEISKLVDTAHIDKATRNVRRLGMALHVAFLVQFLHHLSTEEASKLDRNLTNYERSELIIWDRMYRTYVKATADRNGTFQLHHDVMMHCDEISALHLAERIGGQRGYLLVLASVKSSLPFAFLNNASSYAAFIVELLIQHYSSGEFWRNMKMSLFSSKHGSSATNFALDTTREIDHELDLKGFRPGSTLESVTPRVAAHDLLREAKTVRDGHKFSKQSGEVSRNEATSKLPEYCIWTVSDVDLKVLVRLSVLIYSQNGLSENCDDVPKNVYARVPVNLPETILDSRSYPIGEFMIRRYLCLQQYFGLGKDDVPTVSDELGPKPLVRKVRTSRSTTINRVKVAAKKAVETERQVLERKRRQKVARESRFVDCISSPVNACLALCKPDGTKNTVPKASGISSALLSLLTTEETSNCAWIGVVEADLRQLLVHKKVAYVTVEWAGVKFKIAAKSGLQYMKQVQTIIQRLQSLTKASKIVLVEEKYFFTPDYGKALTRAKRVKSSEATSILHLKSDSEVLSLQSLHRRAISSTQSGKERISSYIVPNIEHLHLTNLTLIIDSQFIIDGCECHSDSSVCDCSSRYAVPIEVVFNSQGERESLQRSSVKQRKGEGEMSQVDWLRECHLRDGESAVSTLTSGDIDSLPIHLYALSRAWPRNDDGTFKNDVMILLQKKDKADLYNVTKIIRLLENKYGPYSAMRLSVVLMLGGNDFIPKFHGITHGKLMETVMSKNLLNQLVEIDTDCHQPRAKLNEDVYIEVVKSAYCPKNLDPSKLSFDDVRQLSVKPPGRTVRLPVLWMPPKTALQSVCGIIKSQIQYLDTCFDHGASLPDFLRNGGLKLTENTIQYDFGSSAHVDNHSCICLKSDDDMRQIVRDARLSSGSQKRLREFTPSNTPQKGPKRRQPRVSTPNKSI